MTDNDWVQIDSLEPGTYDATVVGAERHTAQSGAACVRWTFRLSSGADVTRVTPVSGPGAVWGAEVVEALGLPKRLRLSEAAGKECRVVLKMEGQWLSVSKVMAR